jgi:hypothetical protein
MYNQNDAELVPVKHPSELKPHMGLVLINCKLCGKARHQFMLPSRKCDHGSHVLIDGTIDRTQGWGVVLHEGNCSTFICSIDEGRLFRIVDTFKEVQETVVKKKLVLNNR